MRVIQTHEQADFDALASALGACLLDEHAVPLLPRRLNRNLRAFVTLYGPELPFVEIKDLPPDPIEAVTLVDTQSLNTLKGMNAETQVHVVDHHQLRDDLPESWTVRTAQVGACTTLFVEELHEHNGNLNTLYATLLLLGIYEDTGSLTYASTTARDVRAAAYLLEMGASLQIANKYLNPPLSATQRKVYDRLLAAAETRHIHGQKVIISRGSGEEMSEEISTVAHKLRDLLEPDALFLLVRTDEGIRLVARSTTDQIDVSKIAAYFGGGGHERAAAALMKEPRPAAHKGDEALERIYEQLLARLETDIEPPITVGQIMSRRPLLLSPETPVHKAAQLMQRYGYEGYPVVREGKVVGLLTRRAVDRALGHKLNLTAGSLMEAGEVTVQPRDSLEHLQSVMTGSGWGQVPVVDAKTNEIIGIVTRTDLLKTLTGALAVPGRQNLSSRLEAALPAARLGLLKEVALEA
ncbi:MAG: CBS domain-containing protein, partial [Chloroflexi bacterium]|nr:CBS domain-containing protein [Chloroflexota bacterium]